MRKIHDLPNEDQWKVWYNWLRSYRFKLQQVVFWNETRQDVMIDHNDTLQIRIYRDRDCKVDLKNGKLGEEEFHLLCVCCVCKIIIY